jgi:hypothetical protein
MKTLHFSTTINAPAEKVWKILWEDETYRKWTSAFHEGSYALSSWKEGARVHFLGPSGDGMYSEIAKLIPNEFMSFRHLGMMKGGKEQPETELSKQWAGAMENYTLKTSGNSTELSVAVDIADDHVEMFEGMFPKALAKVKDISE